MPSGEGWGSLLRNILKKFQKTLSLYILLNIFFRNITIVSLAVFCGSFLHFTWLPFLFCSRVIRRCLVTWLLNTDLSGHIISLVRDSLVGYIYMLKLSSAWVQSLS